MSQQLRNVDAVSCAKVMGVLYAIFGLVMGVVFFLVFTLAGIAGNSSEYFAGRMHAGPLGFVLGAGSIVFFPICYGILGALSGLIGAALYNVVAKYTGGIEIELG